MFSWIYFPEISIPCGRFAGTIWRGPST